MKISYEQLKYIHGGDWEKYGKLILSNCFCFCDAKNHKTTIVDFDIFLDDKLNDVLLKGKCVKCGKNISRRLETGEAEGYAERIREIKNSFR